MQVLPTLRPCGIPASYYQLTHSIYHHCALQTLGFKLSIVYGTRVHPLFFLDLTYHILPNLRPWPLKN